MTALIDAKFTNERDTPLEITVPGKNVYNITVEKPDLTSKKKK